MIMVNHNAKSVRYIIYINKVRNSKVIVILIDGEIKICVHVVFAFLEYFVINIAIYCILYYGWDKYSNSVYF